jgi:hypothetical protein
VSITAPAAGSTVSGTVVVSASASDNGTLAGVQFRLDGANLGAEDTSAPYSVSWDTTTASNASHSLTAVARDAAGNTTTSAAVSVTVNNTAPSGLVAGYGFDEGAGTTAADVSGNNNTGTLAGPTWSAAGRFGNAVSFDGINDWITVGDANSLDLTTGMTLEAWVRPTAAGNWSTVLLKEQASNYAYGIYANTGTNRPSGNAVTGGADHDVRGTAALALNTWTHVAFTYSGSSLSLYVNGTQVATQAATGSIATSTGVVRIGGNSIWGEYFAGLIDEVRIYNRSLTAGEIQTDMNRSVVAGDTQAPTAPGTLTANGVIGQAVLNWGPASDNTAVARYHVHRSTTAGFTPSAANRIAQPTGTGYTDGGLASGTYYYKVTAEDPSGNVGPASNEASAAVTADTQPPGAPGSLSATGSAGAVALTWGAATDNVAVLRYNVHRSTTSGFTPSAANRIAQPTGTTYDDTPLNAGTYYYRVTAEDTSGNVGAASSQASAVVTQPPIVGLVAAYGFDEGSGTITADSSGRGNGGTLNGGPTWAIGRHGRALSFDGLNDMVTVADSATLDLTTGMTLEAWVYPTALDDWHTVLFKEQTGNLVYGLYANDRDKANPQGQAFVGGIARLVDGPSQLGVNTWMHLAATYDGSALRLYVNGSQVASTTLTGSIATSSGALRIGGNSVFAEWFRGRLDDVMVYNRALSASELQADMNRSAAPDTAPPTVTAATPAAGTTQATVDTAPTVTFSEAMDATTIDETTFELRTAGGALVPATVIYNPTTATATLTPTGALANGASYTARVLGGAAGAAVKDSSANGMAADYTWTFTVEAASPPVLLLRSSGNPFSAYPAEILRAEGLNDFSSLDLAFLTPALLTGYDVVVLGDVSLTSVQVTTLSNWVSAGGNLIALSPDKQLAGLLGLTDVGTTLSNAYLRVDTTSAPGAGIVGETIQYHGAADRYTLAGAQAVATLYSSATTATSNPAVTLRSVGSNGGQAAAFTFDLARSIAYQRQGNPAWAGQNRDGVLNIRPNDLFFGNAVGDSQPDWVNVSKIAIPQADEQQRLLVNLIETMNADRKPLPRFWYFPRGLKAAVVLTGDDHANGGTAGRFDQYTALGPAGCVVANWECVRATSYIYPETPLTNAQAAAYTAAGFELGLHPQNGTCHEWTVSELRAFYTQQLEAYTAKYTSIPPPVSNRTHCVAWSDWLSMATTEEEKGVRLDTNYYHYPNTWIGNAPGFMTGSGFPMRMVDPGGNMIGVYQANTFMTDESGQSYPATADALLDKALGPEGYYGFFTTNFHTDYVTTAESDATIASARARGVPLISAKQLLDWTEARRAARFTNQAWSNGQLTFSIADPVGTNGLQAMLPVARTGTGTLVALTLGGTPVAFTMANVKGIEYALFPAVPGAYVATYS